MTKTQLHPDGLIHAFRLDGQGGGEALDWNAIRSAAPSPDQPLWMHLDYKSETVQRWLYNEAGLCAVVREAFMAEETRPRSTMTPDGLLVILRGVNLNPGAEPDDMVSVRILLTPQRIISLRHRSSKAVEDVVATIESAQGPKNTGEFLVQLTGRLVYRMADVLSNMDDLVDELEDSVLTMQSRELRPKLSDLRRQMIRMRRYLAPQRDTLSLLQNERVEWLNDIDRVRLRELADRTTRYVEDLDAARDRAAVTQEELASLLAERMEKTMYVLSIVGAIFLPLGLLTGLLGINVGGMPGVESDAAFWIVCVLLVVFAAFEVLLLKRMKWF